MISQFSPLQSIDWGPELPIKPDRVKYDYSDNLAPSYVPNAWLKNPLLSLHTSNIKKIQQENVVVEFSDDIKNHVENRIQLFFQQLLLFYKTSLCFENYNHADAQVGVIGGNGVAAHSGTLPTLRLKPIKHACSISVAHGTPFYYDWNTTVYLPSIVNHYDSAIDFQSRSHRPSLRNRAIDILNQVSMADLNPKEGLLNFLKELISISKENERSYANISAIYISIAQKYKDKTENGFLIHELCSQPNENTLDEEFYFKIQVQMHRHLIKKELHIERPLNLSNSSIDFISIKKIISQELKNYINNLSNTPSKFKLYVSTCSNETTSYKVHHVVFAYFIYLSPLNDEKEALFRRFLQKPNEDNTPQASLCYQSVIKTLQNLYSLKRTPHHISLIIGLILLNVSDTFSKQATPSQIVSPSSESVKKSRELINNKITPFQCSSKTVNTHVSRCKLSEKIQQVVRKFFQIFFVLDNVQQDLLLDEISKINENDGRSKASEITMELYNEVKKALKPQTKNLHMILLKLLLNGIEDCQVKTNSI